MNTSDTTKPKAWQQAAKHGETIRDQVLAATGADPTTTASAQPEKRKYIMGGFVLPISTQNVNGKTNVIDAIGNLIKTYNSEAFAQSYADKLNAIS